MTAVQRRIAYAALLAIGVLTSTLAMLGAVVFVRAFGS